MSTEIYLKHAKKSFGKTDVIKDPNLTIRVDALDRKAENILTVKMEIVQIPLAVASDMAGAVKKFF